MPRNRSGLLYSLITFPQGIARSGILLFAGIRFLKAQAVNVWPLIREHSGSDMPMFSNMTEGSTLILSMRHPKACYNIIGYFVLTKVKIAKPYFYIFSS